MPVKRPKSSSPTGSPRAISSAVDPDRSITTPLSPRAWHSIVGVLLAACALAVLAPASALAVTQTPQWTVTAYSEPTNLPPGGSGAYTVEVRNTGGVATDGSEISVSDVLPPGLTAEGSASGYSVLSEQEMSCTGLTCTYSGVIVPEDDLILTIPVKVAASPANVTNLVRVSGGGAPEATRETPTTISSTSAPFGIAPGSTATALSTTQAGAHADLTTSLSLDTDSIGQLSGYAQETGLALPPGFVIDVADTPKCSAALFSEQENSTEPKCPSASQIGTVTLLLDLYPLFHSHIIGRIVAPVYNLTTNPGELARIGFFALFFGVQGTIEVRPGDYGGTTKFQNIHLDLLAGASVTVWGVPSAASHTPMRGLSCLNFSTGASEGSCEYDSPTEGHRPVSAGGFPSASSPTPFFTNLTQCTGEPLEGTLFAGSWEEPSKQQDVATSLAAITGCDQLEFGPYISAAPDTTHADTPAGFTFDVKIPQEGLVSAGGLSTADIENTKATLPQGVAINPGQAAGLGACQLSEAGIGVSAPPACPANARVGEVEVESPLITRPLKGSVYLLASNPPDIKLLVAPEDPVDGLYVKFVGDVHLNEATGQLVTTFEKTPSLPFSNLRLSFSGGAQAALSTPTGCGVYTTRADFAPWTGESEVPTRSDFAIDSGTGTSACASPLPFSPSLIAGATTDQAGGFTAFSLLLQHADDQQRIASLQFKVPEGLLGMISKVPLCGESQASRGECASASQIGHTVVEAGPGPYPLVVPQPGSPPAPIYLTGGYKGAPYGLAIVVPLVVGPFTLETQIVRARIEVDPYTAQLTVTTDPFPTIIDGVPSDLRTIDAVIDRPGFMFNPTSCAPMAFGGTATSTEGVSAPIASHFQVGSCQSLEFKPDFKVSTSAKTSRLNGASLTAKIVYPTGTLPNNQASSQSNIKLVKVELPKILPSRLTTLQKACAAAVFEANPANCPQASVVGHATAITPVLPVALTGPAYFVSHGGEAFPSLIVVLQGYGTTVDLVGSTFISKAGVTSSTFKQVPDVPITSFELVLPEGPYSALAANGNLCKAQSLVIPTEFIAQNGAELKRDTPIAVNGCKPAIVLIRHSVKGARATIVMKVPAAGELVASGAGLARVSSRVGGAGNVTLALGLSASERGFLGHHRGRRLKAVVRLTFTPRHGGKLTSHITLLLG